jgi:serine protease
MKTLRTCIAIVICSSLIHSALGKNPESASGHMYKGAEYQPGKVVVKVIPDFRTYCTSTGISHPKLTTLFQDLQIQSVAKKFPTARKPEIARTKKGTVPVDLSLVYQLNIPSSASMDKTVNALMATGLFEFAEPLYVQYMNYTPNDPSLSQQYFIGKINAYNAWDIWKGDTNTVIGIIDSGTDWDHPDLQGNIKFNYADPINGIDDDNDGFTDNYRGWDVSENDNDPTVGSSDHGSHVSGCAAAVTDNGVGVASPGFYCKFLPVKSTADASATTIDNGYDGITYATDHGANVINCSWGRSGSPSSFEELVVKYAVVDHDIVFVAAAGNGSIEEEHYPSSYVDAMSVASTASTDAKSGFSSFSVSVDIAAPGTNIYSTVFNNSYVSNSGTSMASPVLAGCAAMVRSKNPSFTNEQVRAQLRTTSDNIYTVSGNSSYFGKLGKGRVNLFKAITDSVSPGVILKSTSFSDYGDDVFVGGDTVRINALLENLLRPTSNLVCSLTSSSSYVTILQNTFNVGILNTFDTASNFLNPFSVKINPTAPLNSEVVFRVWLIDGTWTDNYLIKLIVNVDYINIQVNDIGTSITSRGMIGYNQFGQIQGLGFTYQGSATLLFDMGLMIGAPGTQVSDVVRNTGAGSDEDFQSVVNVSGMEPGIISDFDAIGKFNDSGPTSNSPLNILITHHAYAWQNAPDNKYVMVQYWIKNNGASAINGLSAGLFADWDIPLYSNNKCSTDNGRKLGYIWSTDTSGLYAGIKVLNINGGWNHYALDNIANNGGIEMTDGYDETEKFQSMTTMRADAGTSTVPGNDVLSVVSTGPFNVNPGDSVEASFALVAGEDLSIIQDASDNAQIKYNNVLASVEPISLADRTSLIQVYPNPSKAQSRIEFSLGQAGQTELSIYNSLGVKVKTILSEKLNSGRYTLVVDMTELSSGTYYCNMVTGSFNHTLPLNIIR